MCLLEHIVSWDSASVILRTLSHRSPDNPLRNSNGRIRALHLCEYGAQAMAVHGALISRAAGERPKPGLLVSLRAVRLLRDFIDDICEPLEVRATLLLASAESWQYAFSVRTAQELLAEGRAAILARDAERQSQYPRSAKDSAKDNDEL